MRGDMDTKVVQGASASHEGSPSDEHSGVKRNERGTWAQSLMVLGIFAALFTFYSVCQLTLLSVVDLFRLFFFMCFVLLLIPHRYTRKRLGMDKLEWFFFNTLAIGPITFCIVMWANFFVHGEVEYRDYSRYSLHRLHSNEHASELTNGWIEFNSALTFLGPSKGTTVRVGKARGIFGIDVVVEKESTDAVVH